MITQGPPHQTDLSEARTGTDYAIPAKWICASIAAYTTWTAIAVISYVYSGDTSIPLASVLGGLGLAGFVFSALSSYLVYRLVNRRNQHFAREENLLWSTLDTARATVQQSDMRLQIALSSAERDLTRLAEKGKEHSAVLWALLTLIPYAGWIFLIYVLSFLSNDLRKHEMQEDLVLESLGGIAKVQRGVDLPIRHRRVPNRPVILYATLNILGPGILLSLWLNLAALSESVVFLASGLLLLGIVQLLWLFQSVKDPNSHFEHHVSIETILWPEATPGMSFRGPG